MNPDSYVIINVFLAGLVSVSLLLVKHALSEITRNLGRLDDRLVASERRAEEYSRQFYEALLKLERRLSVLEAIKHNEHVEQ